MKQKWSLILYIVLALLMLIDFYLIFNVGNPNSLVRYIVASTDYDMAITLGVSLVIAFLSFYVFRAKKVNPAVGLLEQNRSYVKELRSKGRSNSEIAESFLEELKPGRLTSRRIRRQVIEALEEME
jgi:hypothetical protein